MDDDKILDDIIQGVAALCLAFRKNNLGAPLIVGVDHETHTRLKMLRHSTMVVDPKTKGAQVQIHGVVFEAVTPRP